MPPHRDAHQHWIEEALMVGNDKDRPLPRHAKTARRPQAETQRQGGCAGLQAQFVPARESSEGEKALVSEPLLDVSMAILRQGLSVV